VSSLKFEQKDTNPSRFCSQLPAASTREKLQTGKEKTSNIRKLIIEGKQTKKKERESTLQKGKKKKKNPPPPPPPSPMIETKALFLCVCFFLLPTSRCPTHVWGQFPKEF